MKTFNKKISGTARQEATTTAEPVKEKQVVLPKRPRLEFYQAFLICSDGERKDLGVLVGKVGENLLGAAFKRAYLVETDSLKVSRVKFEKVYR